MDTVAGRTVVITGGASGIGRATAVAMARRGARIVVADVDERGADQVAHEISGHGTSAIAVACDVSRPEAFEQLKDAALDRFGRVDVVMNNVGVLVRGRPEKIPVSEWTRVLETNLLSVVRSNEVFIPLLKDQGAGHIVNTASFAGLFTYSYDRLPYAASKAAVIQISEGLRLYLTGSGVGVTVLCPGPVATNIMSSLPADSDPDLPTRGPGAQFPVLAPETVGEQVVRAVLDDTFMLYTHENVQELLTERASDWNGFIHRQALQFEDPAR